LLVLALSNLVYRKGRSAITILGVGVGIMLLLVVIGMTEGSIREVVNRMLNVDADLIVHKRGFLLGANSGAPLREAYRDVLGRIDGVQDVVPAANWWITVGGQNQNVLGVRPEDLPRIKGLRRLVAGRDFQSGNEMVIDQRLADAAHIRVGDTVQTWDRPFTVVGVCETGVPTRVMMPLKTLQDAAYYGSAACTFFFLKCRSARAVEPVMRRVNEDEALGMRALPVGDYYRLLTENLKFLKQFVWAVTAVGLVISFLVIALSMYTAVLERTREVGILKSLGAGWGFIVGSIVAESVLLCLGGVVAGLGLAALLKTVIERALPLMTVSLTAQWIGVAAGLGIGGGILGALYPARKAARLDPVVSLSYE
jgi:putative ABC transport system permease protein